MPIRPAPWVLTTVLMALVIGLAARLLAEPLQNAIGPASGDENIQRLVLLHATLPRLAMAALCGAGLALAGALLQQVLRNPLASPDTVGVNAGARLALSVSTLVAPDLLGWGRDLVAVVGASLAATTVLLIARRRRYSPLALILAGLVVSLYCGALATVMLLLKDRYLTSLFIWGSGSLSQQSWEPALGLGLRLGLCLMPLLLLMRPLAVLNAGDETARGLGVAVERVRVMTVGLAVLMSAFVTAAVGVIGFIGLAGPLLARLSGPRGFASWCRWSALHGALLLLGTDLLVQNFGGQGAAFLPTGAVTAVVGAPLLLLLLPRLKTMRPPQADAPLVERAFAAAPVSLSVRLVAGLVLMSALSLLVLVGRGPGGTWALLSPSSFPDVLPWRLPRLLGAAGAGGLLAVAGYILQRVTANPLASPEVIGVSAGAVLGAALALVLGGSASALGLTLAATVGSFAALIFVLAISFRAGAMPERVLLAGVALTALVDAVVGVLTAAGDPNSVVLVAWLSGSASSIDLRTGVLLVCATVLLTLATLPGARWLTALPLGSATAVSIGVPVVQARMLLLMLAALMTAIATPVIGPLTFVGLMAPHIVALLGVRQVRSGLLLSALIGASLMMLADTLARVVAFPLQLPTGILACLLSVPFLLVLVSGGGMVSRRTHSR